MGFADASHHLGRIFLAITSSGWWVTMSCYRLQKTGKTVSLVLWVLRLLALGWWRGEGGMGSQKYVDECRVKWKRNQQIKGVQKKVKCVWWVSNWFAWFRRWHMLERKQGWRGTEDDGQLLRDGQFPVTENSYKRYWQTAWFLFKLLHMKEISLSLLLFTLMFQMLEVCAELSNSWIFGTFFPRVFSVVKQNA